MKLDRALAYVELGWAVFPLIPNTKKPLTRNGFKDASKSVYTVEQWWREHPDANIGIATGEVSGIAVVDVDVKNGAKGLESLKVLKGISPTLTAVTPSGGLHYYYYAAEPLKSRNGVLPGIDFKADGGYVVAPGSVIDGKVYEWEDAEAHLSFMADELIASLSRKKEPVMSSIAHSGAVAEGSRNSTLASIAGSMRRKGMSADEILAALKVANHKRCSPPLEDKEVETIAGSIARYEPEEDDPRPPGFTDDALALDFTRRFKDDWRYVAAWGHWLHWNGSSWKRETTLKAFDLARSVCREAAERCLKPKIAAKIASASTVAAVERLARADRNHAASTDHWDANPWLLNTPAGTIDLHVGSVRENTRTDYMTKTTLAGTSQTSSKPERWLNFLNDVTDGDQELQNYLARMAGYALTGATSEHALFFLYGTGANGKSVFLNTLAAVFGDYAVNAPMDTFLESRNERHPTDLAGLRGARLVVSIEVEKGCRWAEAKIKSLTGGDKISARFMRQDFFEYKPQFKLIIAGNNKPAIRDVDEAMRRRLHLIPFTITVPKEKRDPALPEKLLQEKDGILRWALQGCLEWQKTGLKPPARVVSATEEYLESEDALGRWIDDECMVHPNTTSTTEELYRSWKIWAERWGEYVPSMKKFSEDLAKRGFIRNRTNRQKGFRGISLKGTQVQEDML